MITADHPKLAGCTASVLAPGVEKWHADHGCLDNKGRKIGGRVIIDVRGSSFVLDVQITRDGILYGASRRVSTYGTLDDARAAALEKLQRQRKQARDRYGAKPAKTEPEEPAYDGRYARPIKIF